jgi:hypothetical protein
MSVDMGMRASLVEAGLVDPSSGAFTSEPNFGGPSEGGAPARNEPDPTADEPLEEVKKADENGAVEAGAATVPDAAPNTGAGVDLGTQNPARLGADTDPVRQQYDQTISTLDQQAEMAFHYGRTLTNSEGQRVYSDEQLAAQIGQELQAAKQQAYLAGVMQRLQPVAQRAAAEKIAKEHGVDVQDILNESSPVAMSTRAKTIAELKRDGRFQERKKNGTDTAEGSRGFSNAVPEAIDKLSPQQKMYVGFARGDH